MKVADKKLCMHFLIYMCLCVSVCWLIMMLELPLSKNFHFRLLLIQFYSDCQLTTMHHNLCDKYHQVTSEGNNNGNSISTKITSCQTMSETLL